MDVYKLTQLPASNFSIFYTPALITYGAPCVVNEDFYSAVTQLAIGIVAAIVSTHKSNRIEGCRECSCGGRTKEGGSLAF